MANRRREGQIGRPQARDAALSKNRSYNNWEYKPPANEEEVKDYSNYRDGEEPYWAYLERLTRYHSCQLRGVPGEKVGRVTAMGHAILSFGEGQAHLGTEGNIHSEEMGVSQKKDGRQEVLYYDAKQLEVRRLQPGGISANGAELGALAKDGWQVINGGTIEEEYSKEDEPTGNILVHGDVVLLRGRNGKNPEIPSLFM